MVKINGIKATETSSIEKEISPSINEILDRMENNFEARKVDYSKSGTTGIFDGFDNPNNVNTYNKVNTLWSNGTTQTGNDSSNLLLNILPMLLSKDKNSYFKNSQNEIIKQLLKKTNNPMLLKLFELMPKLAKEKNTETENTKAETKKEKNIDDFVKAEDYQNKEN